MFVGKYFFQLPEGQPSSDNAAGRIALLYREAEDDRLLLLFDMDNTPPDCSPADFD